MRLERPPGCLDAVPSDLWWTDSKMALAALPPGTHVLCDALPLGVGTACLYLQPVECTTVTGGHFRDYVTYVCNRVLLGVCSLLAG